MNTLAVRKAFDVMLANAEKEIERELQAKRSETYKAEQNVKRLETERDALRADIRNRTRALSKEKEEHRLNKSGMDQRIAELLAKNESMQTKLHRLEDMERLGQLQKQ